MNFDAKFAATEMDGVAARLQLALAADEAVGPVVKLQDYRDRLFTLTSMQIGRIRAYATYAFRDDATERRRKAFASDFVRAKNRAAKRRNKQKEGAANHDEPGSPAVPAEPFLKVGQGYGRHVRGGGEAASGTRSRGTQVDLRLLHLRQVVDGLPLAIELAAAQAATLLPSEIRERLAAHLDARGRARPGTGSGAGPEAE